MFVQYWVNMWTQRKADEQNYVGPTQSSTTGTNADSTKVENKEPTFSQQVGSSLGRHMGCRADERIYTGLIWAVNVSPTYVNNHSKLQRTHWSGVIVLSSVNGNL